MAKRLSKIGYIMPVESISRKFAPRHETSRANRGSDYKVGPGYIIPSKKWIGAASIESLVIGVGNVTKNILVCRAHGRQSLATSHELLNRADFNATAIWVAEARKDLMAINSNNAKFLAAKADFSKTIKGVSARGYQGMFGWMFAVAMAIRKDNEQLPVDHLLPAFDA